MARLFTNNMPTHRQLKLIEEIRGWLFWGSNWMHVLSGFAAPATTTAINNFQEIEASLWDCEVNELCCF